ncbi:solute carrier family 35 member G1-like [Strongylocentrotus purpuratus]|uniref:EamA domain-containing protein n=1 Tax=Strongylocentrotus purpuratus TaxID=7668 RepID=A0A7M7PMK6_STRPU|nr:solute carrier family 35 member G1-like [Strongylocentrotus purpuratus]
MPISTAKAIQYTAPIFAAFLGWLLLKESCSFVDTFLSFVSFGGVILVVQPPFVFQNVEGVEPIPDSTILGSILCLVNACLVGLTFVILRKLSIYGIPPVTVLIVYSIVGMIFSGALTTIFGQWTIPQCGLDRFTLIGNGILLLSVQFMEYIALKTERASTVGLIRSSDIIFSFILEFLIFDIRPNALTIVGAFVIMASLVGLTVKKGRNKEPISEDDDP